VPDEASTRSHWTTLNNNKNKMAEKLGEKTRHKKKHCRYVLEFIEFLNYRKSAIEARYHEPETLTLW
jgi:protein tyrosine/serine phosphatase